MSMTDAPFLSPKSKCLICRKSFDNPKTLPCGHVFCEECIREYIVSRGYDVFGFFPCPVCQLGITIPMGGITQFYSKFDGKFTQQPQHDIRKNDSLKPDKGPTSISVIKDPQGLSCTKDNLIVLTDKRDSKIMIFNLEYQLVSCFSCKEQIYSCTVSNNDTLLVTNTQLGQPLVLEFNLTGKRCGMKTTLNKMEPTYGVTVLKEPVQYIVSVVDSNSLYILNESGKLLKKICGRALLGHPYYLCSDHSNDIIVSDKLNHCIKILDRNGKLKMRLNPHPTAPQNRKFAWNSSIYYIQLDHLSGQMGTSKDCLFEPAGLCTDQHNNIIIADSGNRCIKIFSKCGKFVRIFADFDSQMERPTNVAITNDNQHVIILLTGNKPRFLITNYDLPIGGKMLNCVV